MSETSFDTLLRASAAYGKICADHSHGLNHAYAVISPDDDAVTALFRLIAKKTFCMKDDACGECQECRKIENGNHPDVFYVNRERVKIKVADVKEMLSSANIKALSGKKLYFVERADLMGADAQNKLLKTLEEPPAGVHFFLGAANETGLLDTVRSRCREIFIDRFAATDIFDALLSDGVQKDKAEVAAACCEGLLGKAKKIAASEEYADTYALALNVLENMNKSADVIKFSAMLQAQKDANDFLNVLSVLLRDVMTVHSNPELITSAHLKDRISALTERYSQRAAAEILQIINKERVKLSLNVNRLATTDDLLFSVLEVRYKWRQSSE